MRKYGIILALCESKKNIGFQQLTVRMSPQTSVRKF